MRRIPKLIAFVLAGLTLVLLTASSTFAYEWWRNARVDCRVGAFMYHAVVPDSEPAERFHIRYADFVRHLEELDAAGVRVVDPLIYSATGTAGPSIDHWCAEHDRVALITFDAETPSYHSELSVPELETRGMAAAYFVVTGYLDQGSWVSLRDVEAMRGAGMRVGSHSHRHPLMTRIPPELVQEDLSQSAQVLAEREIDEPWMMALPGGRYDQTVLSIAEKAGFRQVFTSDPCFLQANTAINRICRIEIRGDHGPSPAEFLESPLQVGLQGWSWRWKRRVERVAGERLWARLAGLRR